MKAITKLSNTACEQRHQWPGIMKQIKQMIEQCSVCAKAVPKQVAKGRNRWSWFPYLTAPGKWLGLTWTDGVSPRSLSIRLLGTWCDGSTKINHDSLWGSSCFASMASALMFLWPAGFSCMQYVQNRAQTTSCAWALQKASSCCTLAGKIQWLLQISRNLHPRM